MKKGLSTILSLISSALIVTAGNPVLPEFHADPEIMFSNGRYYIYSTTDGVPGWGGYYFIFI